MGGHQVQVYDAVGKGHRTPPPTITRTAIEVYMATVAEIETTVIGVRTDLRRQARFKPITTGRLAFLRTAYWAAIEGAAVTAGPAAEVREIKRAMRRLRALGMPMLTGLADDLLAGRRS